MKYRIYLFILFLFIIFSVDSLAFGSKISCDYAPLCSPVMEQCGECSYRTRVTLCDGGCSGWSACDQPATYGTQPMGLTDGCYEEEYRNYFCPGDSATATYDVIIHDDPDNDGFDECSDCDQSNGTIHPNATESCDGIDNDCDGEIDEDSGQTYYADSDTDGFGDPDSSVISCTQPLGYVTDNTDCDDTNDLINPNATEVCDALDNDCDGAINEGLLHAGPLNPKQDGICTDSYQSCDASVIDWFPDYTGGILDTEYEGNTETSCDNIDNDCDGDVDENVLTTFYYDYDNDGYGRDIASTERCAPLGYYRATQGGDCDDAVANCTTDCSTLVYYDSDADGYGDSNITHRACDAPENYISQSGDCNDAAGSQHPNQTEQCDGLDNNCDGEVDEGWINFTERDTQLNTNQQGVCLGSLQQCDSGVWIDWYETENIPLYQDSEYLQDGVDNDCDGVVDEGLLPITNVSCQEEHAIPGMINCSFDNPFESTASSITIYATYYPGVSYDALIPEDFHFLQTVSLFGSGTYSFLQETLPSHTEIELFFFSDNMTTVNTTYTTITGGAPEFGLIINSPLHDFTSTDGSQASVRDAYDFIRSDAIITNNRFQSIVRDRVIDSYLYPWIEQTKRSSLYTYQPDLFTEQTITP